MNQTATGAPGVADPDAMDLDQYRLFTKIGTAEGASLWYARLRGEESDGSALVVGRRIDSSAGYEKAAQLRTASERMIRLYVPPRAESAALAVASRSWASHINAQRNSMRHPHILHTYEASAAEPLSPFLVTEFPEGGCLQNVLSVRKRLEPGECASVVAHVGRVISWLHSQETAYGDLSASRVFLTRNSVSLVTPPWPDPWRQDGFRRSDGGKAQDVRAFAELIWLLLTGRPAGTWEDRIPLPMSCPSATKSVVKVLEAALGPDPSSRPDIQEMALVIRGAWEATPVDLHSVVDEEFAARLPARAQPQGPKGTLRRNVPQRLSSQRTVVQNRVHELCRRHWKSLLTLALLALTVAQGGSRLLPSRDSPDPVSSSNGPGSSSTASQSEGAAAPPPQRVPEEVTGALPELFKMRDEALRARDSSLVSNYATAGSEVEKGDIQRIAFMKASSVAWPNLETRIEDIEVEPGSDGTVRAKARLAVTGWSPKEPGNAETGDGSQRIEILLESTAGSWKMRSVDPVRE